MNARGHSKAQRGDSARTEGWYRELLEAAPDAMVVVNRRVEIVLLNLQTEKQFGFHRAELLGQPVRNIIPRGVESGCWPMVFARWKTCPQSRSARGSNSRGGGGTAALFSLR